MIYKQLKLVSLLAFSCLTFLSASQASIIQLWSDDFGGYTAGQVLADKTSYGNGTYYWRLSNGNQTDMNANTTLSVKSDGGNKYGSITIGDNKYDGRVFNRTALNRSFVGDDNIIFNGDIRYYGIGGATTINSNAYLMWTGKTTNNDDYQIQLGFFYNATDKVHLEITFTNLQNPELRQAFSSANIDTPLLAGLNLSEFYTFSINFDQNARIATLQVLLGDAVVWQVASLDVGWTPSTFNSANMWLQRTSGNRVADFDNLMVGQVPEPGSAMLVLPVALIGGVWSLRRHLKAA